MNEQRIKLAKAMGWVPYPLGGGPNHMLSCWEDANNKFREKFDPFIDANDDFAVLEWMRGEARRDGISLLKDAGLLQIGAWQYQIGDYARAALKVINTEND